MGIKNVKVEGIMAPGVGGAPSLEVVMDGDGAFPDLAGKTVHHVLHAKMAMLLGGMAGGRTSIALKLDIGDKEAVFFQTSLDLLESAVKAFRAREELLASGIHSARGAGSGRADG